MHRSKKSNKGNQRKPQSAGSAMIRPLQGIDQKQFILNDIVPIVISNPTNDTSYQVIISADVNGYTWTIQNQSATTVAAGTNLYGNATEQFAAQAMFFTQYYTKGIQMELTLSSGGAVYSLSPIVSLVNPYGGPAFTFGTGDFLSILSSPQETQIHQPYTRSSLGLNYEKWLVAMSNRAWRNTIDASGTGIRELYPTNQPTTQPNENAKLPSLSRTFAVTVPEGTFGAGAGAFVLGVLKFKTTYMFSQRRTDISDLIASKTELIRKEERQRAVSMLAGLTMDQAKDLSALTTGEKSSK